MQSQLEREADYFPSYPVEVQNDWPSPLRPCTLLYCVRRKGILHEAFYCVGIKKDMESGRVFEDLSLKTLKN